MEQFKALGGTMSCKCGNDQFYAFQVCVLDVIVDTDNTVVKDLEQSGGSCDKPHGPYTCTNCGEQYETIEQVQQ